MYKLFVTENPERSINLNNPAIIWKSSRT